MDAESVARYSAWPGVLCYAVVVAWRLCRRDDRDRAAIRGVWTVGWIALVCHVVAAWWLVHQGSWTAAYEHTSRRTEMAVGWSWGGGVWFNLLTTLVWGCDVLRMWIRPRISTRSIQAGQTACQIYLAFMMFNATVVFGSLPMQISGGLFCLGLLIVILRRGRSLTARPIRP